MVSSVAVVHAPRRQPAPPRHALEVIRTSTILAPRGGAHNGVEIEPWGQAHDQGLAALLDRTHGLPSHETLGRVCAVREPTTRPQALRTGRSARANVAEAGRAGDGTTIRRALDGPMAPARATSCGPGRRSMSACAPP